MKESFFLEKFNAFTAFLCVKCPIFGVVNFVT